MRRRVTVAIAVWGALAAAAAACGGGGGAETVDPIDWTADVCDIAVDYSHQSDALGNEFVAVDTSDPKGAQKEYGRILDEVGKFQAAALKQVRALGDPDIDGGAQVREAFVANLKETIKEREQLASTIKALDPAARRFQQDLDAAFGDVDVPSLRDRLAAVIGDHAEAGRIVELIQRDPECAVVLFADDTEPPAATPTRGAAAPTRTPSTAGGTKNERWVGGLCQAVADV